MGKCALNTLGIYAGVLIVVIGSIFGKQSLTAAAEEGPMMQMKETTHSFPVVFEGEDLSHTFSVSNTGKAGLEIRNVTPS